MENRCICCGDIIPEGRQVCYQCEHKVKKCNESIINLAQILKDAFNKITEAIIKFWNSIKKLFREYLNALLKTPKDKRNQQVNRSIYLISNMLGKSNNWRKMHHLPMKRYGGRS